MNWLWLLLVAIVVGAIWGFVTSEDKKEGAAMGGFMGAVGYLHILGYIAATALSIWVVIRLAGWLFG